MINTIIQYLLGHNDDGDIFWCESSALQNAFLQTKKLFSTLKPTDNVRS